MRDPSDGVWDTCGFLWEASRGHDRGLVGSYGPGSLARRHLADMCSRLPLLAERMGIGLFVSLTICRGANVAALNGHLKTGGFDSPKKGKKKGPSSFVCILERMQSRQFQTKR